MCQKDENNFQQEKDHHQAYLSINYKTINIRICYSEPADLSSTCQS